MVKKKILIIDDDVQIRLMLKITLEQAGYKIMEAKDGAEGIEVFRQNKFDLVITDLVMPEKDGLDAILEIKKLSPEIKIFAISGGGKISPDVYLKPAKIFGAIHTFEKPIDRKLLLKKISDVF